jgi:hypothetical protein
LIVLEAEYKRKIKYTKREIKLLTVLAERNPRSHADSVPVDGIPDDGG